jgi:hypothetical protein
MSRYEFQPKHWPDHISCAIGWDPPLITYFAQVLDYSISHDDDCVIVWLGAMPPYYTDLGSLMQTMNRRILGRLHPLVLTATMQAKLIRDQKAAEAATPSRRRRGPVCALDLAGGEPPAPWHTDDGDP